MYRKGYNDEYYNKKECIMITTSQEAFHIMRGHVADDCRIKMSNGDNLTINATIRGWEIRKDGHPIYNPGFDANAIALYISMYGH